MRKRVKRQSDCCCSNIYVDVMSYVNECIWIVVYSLYRKELPVKGLGVMFGFKYFAFTVEELL